MDKVIRGVYRRVNISKYIFSSTNLVKDGISSFPVVFF